MIEYFNYFVPFKVSLIMKQGVDIYLQFHLQYAEACSLKQWLSPYHDNSRHRAWYTGRTALDVQQGHTHFLD